MKGDLMSRMTKKGLTAALLMIGLLAAPVAAAGSGERAEERGAPQATGWFEELAEWVGGWLLGTKSERSPLPEAEIEERDQGGVAVVWGADDNGPSTDPNG